jgi:hypothetical protein
MIGADLAPWELAGRLALALGLSAFIGPLLRKYISAKTGLLRAESERFQCSRSPARCFI